MAAPSKIRIAQLNAENLFLLFDQLPLQAADTLSEAQWASLSSSTTSNKPLSHARHLARTLMDIDPDILMICEVGGRESLENLNRLFLNSSFRCHIIEGNSDRGIDLGYLTRKSLPYKYDLISHKNRSLDFLYPHEKQTLDSGLSDLKGIEVTSHRFSRDVLELRVFVEDQPLFILLQVHLKSQLDRDGLDPQGRDRRKAEVDKLMQIRSEIEQDFQGKVPILIGGDFNGRVYGEVPDPEFESVRQVRNLKDVLEYAQVPSEDRFTHVQAFNGRPSIFKQLDYILVDAKLGSSIGGAFVHRYKDDLGTLMPIPRNFNEKRLLPSDHYPIVVDLLIDSLPKR